MMFLKKALGAGLLALACAGAAAAEELQGVLADWTCIKPMMKEGRATILKRDRACSLNGNYSRGAYGIITDDKQSFRLDDAGRDWALKLLKNTGDKDNLRVLVNGDIDGETIHVHTMSEL
jgi:predicted short-subunit dehydrogenase-like oxidoreductase (DUF2520 family)